MEFNFKAMSILFIGRYSRQLHPAIKREPRNKIYIYIIFSHCYTTKALLIPIVPLRNPRKNFSKYLTISRRLETMKSYFDINSYFKV